MENTIRVTLLDRLGFAEDQLEIPMPLPVVIIHGEKAYLRFGRKKPEFRVVSVQFSDVTPSGAFLIQEFTKNKDAQDAVTGLGLSPPVD